MNGIFEGLPWKLSAFAALVVLITGMISMLDLWVSLERAAIAFVCFWIVGMIGRQIFSSSAHKHESSSHGHHAGDHDKKHGE